MMQSRSIMFLIMSLGVAICGADFYWKDYYGLVPADAFVAAEAFGYSLYIGHASVQNFGLLPGPLLPGTDYIPIIGNPPGHVSNATYYLQILCSNDPENFKWVQANYTTVLTIPGTVQVGFEYFSTDSHEGQLFFGKAFDGQQHLLGKVTAHHYNDGYRNNLYVADGATEVVYSDYEVLVYNALLNSNK